MTTSANQTAGRSALPLLLLGAGADPESERGVSCPGELPPASDPSLVRRARQARVALGDRALILGHHYQRDEVIQFADVTGDSDLVSCHRLRTHPWSAAHGRPGLRSVTAP